MTIRAIVRQGRIEPLDPLPESWVEGQELRVDQTENEDSPADLEAWVREVQECADRIPQEEHDRLEKALEEIERESKDLMRRSWEQQ